MILTGSQRATLHRLVELGADPAGQSRQALRVLRRYGLVDADGWPTDEGRVEHEQQRAAMQARFERLHRVGQTPAERMTERVRRWRAGERPDDERGRPW